MILSICITLRLKLKKLLIYILNNLKKTLYLKYFKDNKKNNYLLKK